MKDALSHGVIAGWSCANTLLWQPGNNGRGSKLEWAWFNVVARSVKLGVFMSLS